MSARCLIVYASMTGNTEEIANLIGEGIRQTGIDVEIKDILLADSGEMLNYDGILLGAYTWGDGELPDEFLDFYEEMDGEGLHGKLAGAFGSCDSSYENRGNAVNILTEKLIALGADVRLEGPKIDLAPSEHEKDLCLQFGRDFAGILIKGGAMDE